MLPCYQGLCNRGCDISWVSEWVLLRTTSQESQAPMARMRWGSPAFYLAFFSSRLKVDAAVASLVDQGLDVDVVEQEKQGEASGAQEPEIDTAVLAERVRHYLKANQIQWTRFSSLVLGVSQGRLSILLGKPKPWQQLAPRVRALYQRMLLWMDTKATFGNNPYMKVKK